MNIRLPRKQKKAIKKANPIIWGWIIGFTQVGHWARKCSLSIKETDRAIRVLSENTQSEPNISPIHD